MIDKETLLKARLNERTVVLDGAGEVRVRGLARAEVAKLRQFIDDPDAGEVYTLALGIVDPPLTEDDVRAWLAVAPNDEVMVALEAILELSGLKETAMKEAVKSFRDGQRETS